MKPISVDTARARSTDPSTSHSAAARVAASELSVAIINALARYGPMTSHEIAERSGCSLVSVSPRIKPLRLIGLVKDTGDRRDGRSVWALADQTAAPPPKPMPTEQVRLL